MNKPNRQSRLNSYYVFEISQFSAEHPAGGGFSHHRLADYRYLPFGLVNYCIVNRFSVGGPPFEAAAESSSNGAGNVLRFDFWPD